MSLWRQRDFMSLWSAQTVSQVGSQVTVLALPLTAILVLQADTFEVGLLGTAQFLPFVLVGLPAGVWVDRLPRRPILIVGDLGRAAALVSIPAAHALGVLTMGQLYAVAFVAGVLTVFFDVAYMAYLPSLVGREHLVEGNSKLEISRSAAQVTGPGLAGALVDLFKGPVAIAVDAASYVGSALFVLRIRRQEPPNTSGTRPRMTTGIAEGLRYVTRHRLLRWIAACTAISNLFGQMAQTVLLVFAVRELDMSPGLIGVVFSAGSVAALAAAFVSTRAPQRIGVGPTIVGAAAIGSAAGLILPLATRSNGLALLVGWSLVVAFAGVLYNVTQGSLRQAITPERMQGRMNATMRFMVWGTIPVGSLLGGVLGEVIGLRPTLVVAAVGGLTAVVPVLFSDVRDLHEVPDGTLVGA
ncbi:MAG TPA: MFS transporter [Acidimicrobiales bacterium]|nr:MFS transporter [Acidimicrobiales bacterium]